MVFLLLLVVSHLMHLVKLVSYGTGRCFLDYQCSVYLLLLGKSNMAFPFLLYSPLYDWKTMEADGFTWWVKRIKRALDLYDEFRIDHFRGLAGFWAVPSGKLNNLGAGSLNPIKYLY
jgi:hypothetical protein